MQKHEVIRQIMKQYGKRTPVNINGLNVLYNRAESRGYQPFVIYIGLRTVICKNYLRGEYEPPNGDITQESFHDRIYIEDWEFREIMKGNIQQ